MIIENKKCYYTREDGTVVEYPECLDVNVTLIEKIYKRNNVRIVPLMDVLTTEEYKDEVERIRAMEDEVERKKAKGELAAYNAYGEFDSLAAGCVPKVVNNLVTIDVDYKDNLQFTPDELKELLIGHPYVAAVAHSAGGKGVVAFVPVGHAELYSEYYRAISKDIYEQLGMVVDKQCSDRAHMRYVSYDPNPLFKPSVRPFTLKETDMECRKSVIPAPAYTTNSTGTNFNYHSTSTDDYGRVLEVVKQLESENRDITDVQREWFEIGQSLANTFGEDGRELYHRVSRLSPSKYAPSDCDRMYTRCLSYRHRSTLSIATFFYYAVKRG